MQRHLHHTFWVREGRYLDVEWLGARYVPPLVQDWTGDAQGGRYGFWLVSAVSASVATETCALGFPTWAVAGRSLTLANIQQQS